MFVNKLFSKSKRCSSLKSSTYYFHMKIKILADFQICISAPLKEDRQVIVMYGFQIATTKDEIFRAIFKTLTSFKSVSHFYTH